MFIVYILFRELEFGGIVVLQRGRKGRLSRSVIPIAPHIVVDQTRRNLPQPPEDLNAPEQEIWNAIMRQHNLNCVARNALATRPRLGDAWPKAIPIGS